MATPPPPTYVISGTVKHTAFNLLVPDVMVKLDENGGPLQFFAYSDNTGHFSFPAVPNGNYAVSAQRHNFSFTDNTLIVLDGDVSFVVTGGCGPATWDSFIAAFVSDSCLQCHRPDAAVPVDPMLNSYSLAKTWGSNSNARIQAGTMPPGGSVPALYKRMFKQWRDNGYPEN